MAVGDAYVFPGFLTPVLTLLFFQSHRLLFSHASAEVRGENTPERKVASTWDRTRNHQVMSPTRSPLSHPGGFSTPGIVWEIVKELKTRLETRNGRLLQFSPFPTKSSFFSDVYKTLDTSNVFNPFLHIYSF